jgi:hypothetical protein
MAANIGVVCIKSLGVFTHTIYHTPINKLIKGIIMSSIQVKKAADLKLGNTILVNDGYGRIMNAAKVTTFELIGDGQVWKWVEIETNNDRRHMMEADELVVVVEG